jgi:flagellar hook-associated protein 1 FlgK
MDRLFGSFSSLSLNPNDLPGREQVLASARDLATAFNRTAFALGQARTQADTDVRNAVDAVNRLAGQLAGYNKLLREDRRRVNDPGLEALIHADLEELAQYTDFTMLRGEDGTYNIYLGGQTALVIGQERYPVTLDFSGTEPRLLDLEGRDVTGQVQQGKVRGLLEFRTQLLPDLEGELNRLASTLADQVNQSLAGGVDLDGLAPEINLFDYDPASAAASLKVTAIAARQLAAARPEAPGGNGNALDLAALGRSGQLDGYSFSQYYGLVAGKVGRLKNDAETKQEAHHLLLTQARSIRAESAEVSLDEEATKLIEFQRAYQASAELVRVLNSLTEETLALMN